MAWQGVCWGGELTASRCLRALDACGLLLRTPLAGSSALACSASQIEILEVRAQLAYGSLREVSRAQSACAWVRQGSGECQGEGSSGLG